MPIENIIYKSGLEKDQIIDILSQNVEPKSDKRTWMSRGSNHKVYEGTVLHDTFKIQRIIHYQNSFLPRICGTITSEGANTKIRVKMSTHPVVIVGIIIFSLFWTALSWSDLIVLFSKGEIKDNIFFLLAPFLAIAMLLGGFKYENLKSKKHLKLLLEAEIV